MNSPLSGEIRDGFIWGRGSWDDKGNLLAILEAVESLVVSGFKPRRTIYLAFGHDEENGGAATIVVAALFAIFVTLQLAYLFGGRDTLDAAAITFSSYARRGFFELIGAVALVGLLLFGLELAVRDRFFARQLAIGDGEPLGHHFQNRGAVAIGERGRHPA